MKVGVIIPAAGLGRRMRGDGWKNQPLSPKQFLTLQRVPILVRALAPFTELRMVREIVVALPRSHPQFLNRYIRRYGWGGRVRIVVGGASRQASVSAAFAQISPGLDVVLVHDAVRPFVDTSLIRRIIAQAYRMGAAIPTVPPADTVKRIKTAPVISETPPRGEFYCAQTPQGFWPSLLGAALEQAARDGFTGTDDAGLVERLGHAVHVVPGSPANIKITRPIDLMLARCLVKTKTLKALPRGPQNTKKF